jgi:hypothetical protein
MLIARDKMDNKYELFFDNGYCSLFPLRGSNSGGVIALVSFLGASPLIRIFQVTILILLRENCNNEYREVMLLAVAG